MYLKRKRVYKDKQNKVNLLDMKVSTELRKEQEDL